MYLLIFEFIGTTEVIFIAIVALIIFGPRKMPDIARQIGKTMNDLRRVSTEFRETWEREVALEESSSAIESKSEKNSLRENDNTELAELENRTIAGLNSEIIENTGVANMPSIKEIDATRMNLAKEETAETNRNENEVERKTAFTEKKRDWL